MRMSERLKTIVERSACARRLYFTLARSPIEESALYVRHSSRFPSALTLLHWAIRFGHTIALHANGQAKLAYNNKRKSSDRMQYFPNKFWSIFPKRNKNKTKNKLIYEQMRNEEEKRSRRRTTTTIQKPH